MYRIYLLLLNGFLVMLSLAFLGDLLEDIEDYRRFTGTFQSFRTSTIRRDLAGIRNGTAAPSRGKKDFQACLAIATEEGTEWFIGEDQQEHWKVLANANNKGKTIRFYNRGDVYFYIDPVRVEIDDQVIYDKTAVPLWKYLIFWATLGLTIYNYWTGRKQS